MSPWPDILLLVFAYALGSIPVGLLVTRTFSSADLRRAGSGNIGATNVRRVAGNSLGVLTLIGDIGKGAFPVWLASNSGELCIGLTAVCAFMGHLFPLYLRGKDGGKGVATAAGAWGMISPFGLIVALLVFVLGVCVSSRVSVGSMAGGAVLPLAIWKATGSGVLTGAALWMAVWILWRHQTNIRRLIAGTEPKL